MLKFHNSKWKIMQESKIVQASFESDFEDMNEEQYFDAEDKLYAFEYQNYDVDDDIWHDCMGPLGKGHNGYPMIEFIPVGSALCGNCGLPPTNMFDNYDDDELL